VSGWGEEGEMQADNACLIHIPTFLCASLLPLSATLILKRNRHALAADNLSFEPHFPQETSSSDVSGLKSLL
jgi:hypothetical protein